MEDLDKIRDRIKKLLALAASGNENEAALALAKAQRLMDEYRISSIELEEVDPSQAEKIIQDNVPLLDGMIRQWKLVLINGLAKYNNCKVISFKSGRKCQIIGFGRPSDLSYLRFIFSQAVVILTQISKFACMFEMKSYYDSWFLGASCGILEKLRESRNEFINESNKDKMILVKFENKLKEVEDFVDKNIGKLSDKKASKGATNYDAFNEGYKKGKEINLDSQSELRVRSSIGVK